MLTAIIVEDELYSREMLKTLLHDYCPEVAVKGTTSSIEEGIHLVNTFHPKLVFLDIALEEGTGFDLLKRVSNRTFDVIFTTAYEHYALRAIKFSAIDYLLKPIDLDELQLAITKVTRKQRTQAENLQIDELLKNFYNQHCHRHTITLATSDGLMFVAVNQIVRLEAMGSYTQFYLNTGKKIMVSKHLKEYEQLLDEEEFCRIHQSHVINLNEVTQFVKADGGYVILKDQTKLKVSPNRREYFLSKMQAQI